ncbi:unnamed protein product [Miscanthus lutarioriparius]|uniref:Uncharacterized protein n=1 Tax=Miscanthus lutarioriparius TaxID=422564 RepID=A0A811SMG0_9POAL|nr:unnamed protein product [Miscanthus lutarioriparius]
MTRHGLSPGSAVAPSCRASPTRDAEARKIGKPSGTKGGAGHAFGRSMRFLPSTRPAGVTLTPGRVAPSDLRRLANAASLDAAADVASSGSECSDASRLRHHHAEDDGLQAALSVAPAHGLRPPARVEQYAVGALARAAQRLAAAQGDDDAAHGAGEQRQEEPDQPRWGHIFHRRKHAAEDASIAAVTATLLSSPVPSRSSGGGGEPATT